MSVWLRRWVENETLAQILGFVILFILIALSINFLGMGFTRLVKKMDLSWADRLGGAGFGFLKAILLIAIILFMLTAFLPSKSKLLSESKISAMALTIARQLSYLVPEKFRQLYSAKEKELKKYWSAMELVKEKTATKGGKGQ
jgi:membrane protein required for colicin V production